MLYPRLVLAKQLLSDSGVIFCSMDDRNQAYVKCLFDEVFGERNFIATFIWKKGHGFVPKTFINTSQEYIHYYSKSFDSVIFNGKPKDEDELPAKYPCRDEKGIYRRTGLRKTVPCDLREDRPKMFYSVTAPDGSEIYPKRGDGREGIWRWGKSHFDEISKTGEIEFVKSDNGWKVYFKERPFSENGELKSENFDTLLLDIAGAANGTNELKEIFHDDKPFDFPKPVKLMVHLLRIASRKDSIVLDFFAGSGTTGQAVLELNAEDGGGRQFILCTSNEKTDTTPNGIACDVTSRRLKRVMTGVCYDGTGDFKWIKKHRPLGGNLDVYDMDSVANFEATEGKTPFDVIDETLYGQEKFATVKEKVEWVCDNFEHTQKGIESEEEWLKRKEEK